VYLHWLDKINEEEKIYNNLTKCDFSLGGANTQITDSRTGEIIKPYGITVTKT